MSKVVPRWLVFSSLPHIFRLPRESARHCNTCVIAEFRGITEVLGWKTTKTGAAKAVPANRSRSFSASNSGAFRHVFHHRLHPLFHFFRGQVSLVGRDGPLVAKGIRQLPIAVTPEHVTDRHFHLCSRL